MNIVFSIVKAAGILILVLLLLLIFLLILFLFIPFRYRLYISFPKTENGTGICLEYMQARVSVRFLGVLLAFVWEYKKKQSGGSMRVLGIPIWPRRKKKGRIESGQNAEHYDEKVDEERGVDEEGLENGRKKQRDKQKDNSEQKDNKKQKEKQEQIPENRLSGFVQKVLQFPHKLSELFSKICHFFKGLTMAVERLRMVLENISEIRSDIHVQNGVSSLLRECRKLWVHVKPGKFVGNVHFGLSDPAQTGQLLGVFSIVYVSAFSAYADTLRIEPDFEHAVLDGELTVAGRVQIVVLIASVWRLYRDKEIKYAWKKVNQFINSFSFGNNES